MRLFQNLKPVILNSQDTVDEQSENLLNNWVMVYLAVWCKASCQTPKLDNCQ